MKRVIHFLPLLFIGHGKLYSQDLKWEELVAIAEKNNSDLLAAQSAVESSQARDRAAFGDFLPQLSGNGSYSKSNTATSLESVSQGRGGGTQDEYALSMTLQQSLFSGFKTKANLDSAKAQLSGARANLAAVESQVFNDLRSAYINVLNAQENIKLLKIIRDRKESNKKLIELRYEGGRENRGAFLRANAQFSQARFELEQAERALRVARRSLARSMGQDQEISDHILGTLEVKIESSTPNFSALATQTPLYRKSESTLAEARASLAQAKSDFFPSLSLSGSGSRRGKDFPLTNDSWSVGSSISFPFFSGGKNYNGVKQAKAEIEKASAESESQRREIEFSMEDAFVKLQDAVTQVAIQKEFLEAAEERAKIARAQYNDGLISFQDWDLIENDFTNTEKQSLQSLRNAALAESAWFQAQGLRSH